MDDVEAIPAPYPPSKPKLPKKRASIFDKIGQATARFRQGVAIDSNSFEFDLALLRAGAGRTNDRNQKARVAQSFCLVPDAAIEWNGQILDDNQDMSCVIVTS